MGLIAWTPALSVGIPKIDAQHQRLITLINRLDEAVAEGSPRSLTGTILLELDAYTREHFSLEEEAFDRKGYPEAGPHKAEHAAFIAKIDAAQLAFATGGQDLNAELFAFLKAWLTRHISFSDKKYRPFLKDLA